MDYITLLTSVATGVGSVGVFIGLLVAWKSGLLSFVWNLKKTNGDEKDSFNKIAIAIISQNERIENLQNNHIVHLKDDISEVRDMVKEVKDNLRELKRDIIDHAEQDARIQGEILEKLRK